MTLALSTLNFWSKISVNINFETISEYTEEQRLKPGTVNSLLDISLFRVDWVGLKGAVMHAGLNKKGMALEQ